MSKNILMCAPTFFDIEYEINPWMHTDNQVISDLALEQWEKLRSIYENDFGWKVKLIEPVEKLPDMVFTANGALVIDGKVALPTFRAPDRQPETAYFKKWFEENGYTEFLEPKYDFEAEGDALVWNDIIFAGYPWRSDQPVHKELASFFNRQVVSLQMVDARFYHLDTCLTIVNDETIAIWPPAFTAETIKKLHDIVPNVIEANDDDAKAYGLNAMSNGNIIVLPEKATNLINKYHEMNMEVIETPISEYQKSGGGVKCLTLELRD
jgi:N-dimethylarginine dimethylaminohydrolase